jgi:WD40 repeat protein/serine/threonine protein kinase
MSSCPPLERLQGLLDEALPEPECAAVAAHVEKCPLCQQSLDQLSADHDSLKWRRLRDPEATPPYELPAAILSQLEAIVPTGLPTVDAVPGSTNWALARGGKELPPPDGYEILEVLGRGGSGVVYKARQIALKRTVALKMLLAGSHAAQTDRARFLDEAETVARLQHPNIVQIYEMGEHQGCPFLALEFVEGQSLAAWLHGRPQPPWDAAELVATLARAIQAAHERGIVHRDLKPANILLQKPEIRNPQPASRGPQSEDQDHSDFGPRISDFVPKITDFGLAKRLDVAGQTQTGQILGTPGYMAPEQARGESKVVGPAADIYAIGSILYHLLTGRPPFQGLTAVDTIVQVLHTEPLSPRRLQPHTPRDLETICLKCIEKDPRKRYATARELADDLSRARSGQTIQARPVSAPERGWRWCRCNPTLAGVLAVLLVVVVVGFAGISWSYLRAERARQEEARQREQAEALLYGSRVVLAEREWKSNNVALADHLLDQCLPAQGRPDHRGWEWYYLKRLCHADLATRQAHDFPIYGLAYSPNGKYLATAAGDPGYRQNPRKVPGEVSLWDADTLQPAGTFTGHTGRADYVMFHRDGGRLISLGHDDRVRVWDAASRRQLAAFPAALASFHGTASVALAPDGRALAVPVAEEVRLLDLSTGQEIGILPRTSSLPVPDKRPGAARDIGHLEFSPDGTRLAVADHQSLVGVWDVKSRRELYQVPGGPDAVGFAPGGKLLATTDGDTIRLREAATGKELRSLRTPGSEVRALAWHPDGLSLASGGDDQTVRVWDAQTGFERRVFRGHTSAILSLAYRPDGAQLASGDQSGVLKVWDAARDQGVIELGPARETLALAFTPDSRQLVAAVGLIRPPQGDSALLSWELPSGKRTSQQVLDFTRRPEYPLQDHILSADGRFLAGPAPNGPEIVRVWDMAAGTERTILPGHPGRIRTLAFSPDGRRLAVACGDKFKDEPREVFLWQLPEPGQSAAAPLVLPSPAPVQCLAFSADGGLLVAGERGLLAEGGAAWRDGHLSVWGANTGRLQRRWLAHPGTVQSLALDPGGRYVASGGRSADQSVRIWELASGRLLHDLQGPFALTRVAFDPQGRRLAAVGYEGTVYLWEPATGQALLTLRSTGRSFPPGVANNTQVVFSPDGTWLAVNGWDSRARVWDARPLAEASSSGP